MSTNHASSRDVPARKYLKSPKFASAVKSTTEQNPVDSVVVPRVYGYWKYRKHISCGGDCSDCKNILSFSRSSDQYDQICQAMSSCCRPRSWERRRRHFAVTHVEERCDPTASIYPLADEVKIVNAEPEVDIRRSVLFVDVGFLEARTNWVIS